MADKAQLVVVGIVGLVLGALAVIIFSGDDFDYRYGTGFGYGLDRETGSFGYDMGYRMGPGIMGPGMMYDYGYRFGSGMMEIGTRAGGMGMMALYFPDEKPISEDEAEELLKTFAARYGDDVRVEGFMIFSNNYYAQVVDTNTGKGLAEILADRYTGVVYPEPGPNMAWNTYFGVGQIEDSIRYERQEARNLAETFLEGYLPGSEVLQAADFPGYCTFDYGREDVEGMLSVNAETGDIWVHTWHGFYLGGHDSEHD